MGLKAIIFTAGLSAAQGEEPFQAEETASQAGNFSATTEKASGNYSPRAGNYSPPAGNYRRGAVYLNFDWRWFSRLGNRATLLADPCLCGFVTILARSLSCSLKGRPQLAPPFQGWDLPAGETQGVALGLAWGAPLVLLRIAIVTKPHKHGLICHDFLPLAQIFRASQRGGTRAAMHGNHREAREARDPRTPCNSV